MSEENFDDIGEILDEFRRKKDAVDNPDRDLREIVAPPVRRDNAIDFSKESGGNKISDEALKNSTKIKKVNNPERKKPTPEEKQAAKEKRKAALLKIRAAVFNKRALTVILVSVLAAAAASGIGYAVSLSKTAYLKPYEEKYPDVTFPAGISEKYCDMFGENPYAAGYIQISDISLETPVFCRESGAYPMAEDSVEGSEINNFVVYMNDNSLEALYKSAAAYNNASGFLKYSDLCDDYCFKVVGAFYTNTDPADDNGYVFPYNVTEKMTVQSSNEFVSRLNSRFIYSTGITLTRQDKLITISCDTEYRENYRFVVVGLLCSENAQKPVAAEKESSHYQQVIYDEKGIENPYRFASDWYPEIIIYDENSNESTIVQTIDDFL